MTTSVSVELKFSGQKISDINKLAEKKKLQGWSYAIARNAIIDYYRVNGSNKNISVDIALENNLPDVEITDATMDLISV